MTADELVTNINSLAVDNEKGQGLYGNYGIGSKVACLFRNPYGVYYYSWTEKSDEGNLIIAYRDEFGRYGLYEDDGQYVWTVNNECKPEIIERHGTCVVLMGKSQDSDTYAPWNDDNFKNKVRWQAHYLNHRYTSLPKDINIKTSVLSHKIDFEGDLEKDLSIRPTNVIGYDQVLLNNILLEYDIKDFEDFKVHWFITNRTPENVKKRLLVNFLNSDRPNIALRYRRERYEVLHSPACYRYFEAFGITAGYSQIVIHVEPNEEYLQPDGQRRSFIYKGEPVTFETWLDWGEQFKANMPASLLAFLQTELAKEKQKDIKELEKEIQDIIRSFAAFEAVEERPDGDEEAGGDEDHFLGGKRNGDGDKDRGENPGPAKQRRLVPGGKNSGRRVLSQLDIPDRSWTTPELDERLENRMAYYDILNNHLKLNENHVYVKFLVQQVNRNGSIDGELVTEAVQKELERELVKRIITYKLHARKLEEAQSDLFEKGFDQLSLEFSICNIDNQVKNINTSVKESARHRQVEADRAARQEEVTEHQHLSDAYTPQLE